MKQDLELKTRRSILCGRNSGQAVVEYILIVSIAIALVFIMKGTFQGMSKFIDNYIGSYTECLMAHGELPALGVTNSDLKEHLSSSYTCNTGFKAFTLSEGRPPIAGGSSTNPSGGNSSANGGNNNASTSSNGSDSSKDKNGDKKAMGSNGASGSNPYSDGTIRRGGKSTADGIAAGNNNQRLIEDEGDEIGGQRRRPRESRIIYRDRPRQRSITGDEANKLVNQSLRSSIKRTPTARAIAQAEGGSAPGPRKGLMPPPPEKKVIEEEIQDSGWGFGKMLKWLLIIAIIVALVIFFGGQLLNYSNSDSS